MYHWEGFYLGPNLGVAFISGSATDQLSGINTANSIYGVQGGATFGYNWQFTPNLVVGTEATFDGVFNGKADLISIQGRLPGTTISGRIQGSSNTDWISTVALRVGYAQNIAQNDWLFYGKVGGGWMNNKASFSIEGERGYFGQVGLSHISGGWLVGGGIEYGVTRYWTVKVELDYLGMFQWTAPVPLALGGSITVDRQLPMLVIGGNYKF